jgi:hypothetical protein
MLKGCDDRERAPFNNEFLELQRNCYGGCQESSKSFSKVRITSGVNMRNSLDDSPIRFLAYISLSREVVTNGCIKVDLERSFSRKGPSFIYFDGEEGPGC